jgi:lipopolysaccharide transport system ATP-binding protein
MGEVAKEGRTVLFVSHNMAAVENLCGSCLWLSEGREVGLVGIPSDVIQAYLASDVKGCAEVCLRKHPNRTRGSRPVMKHLTLLDGEGRATSIVSMQHRLGIRVRFQSYEGLIKPVLGVVVRTMMGMAVFGVNNRFIRTPQVLDGVDAGEITCWLDRLPLMPGLYCIDLHFGDYLADIDWVPQAAYFEVVPADVFGTGQLCPGPGGPVCWPASFEISRLADNESRQEEQREDCVRL